MRHLIRSLAALIVLSWSTPAAFGIEARLVQYPDIRGEVIVFTWEGDLWKTTLDGGCAQRLTAHPGLEYAAKISPDGQTVAFTASYDGTPAIYTIPIAGGEPRRLTWTGMGVQPVAWTPDGQRVVYRSGHENTFRPIVKLFSVPREGGYPERLPIERGILASFSPDGSRMVYNRRGNEEYYWKRYKGGQYTDIWLYDFTANRFEALTDYVGKNAYPMWVGETMYFASDRGENGITNLYRRDFATGRVAPVTRYTDLDIHYPSTDGKRIVFVQAGTLKVLDPATGEVREVPVEVTSDRWQLAARTINPSEYIQSMAAADDGRSAVFEARGDLFVVPADPNLPTRNLTNTPGVRERWPQLSPDGKRVAYFSDATGEYQLWVRDLAGEKPAEQITTGLDRHVYHLEWSPDGKKILFGNKDFALFWVDLATKKLTRFASSNQLKNDQFYWEVSDYSWSPDSRWIAYSFVQLNRNNRIFLYDLEKNESHPVTDGFYDSLNPSFDANGDYLYYLSYRNFRGRIDIFEDNHVIPEPVVVMAVQLRAGQRPPFAAAPKEEEREGPPAPPAAAREGKKEKAAPAAPAAPAALVIDLDGLAERAFQAPVKPGNYFYLKAGKGLITFAEKERFGEGEIDAIFAPSGRDELTLHLFSMAEKKDVTLDAKIADWRLSANREQVLVKAGPAYHLLPLAKLHASRALGEKLDLGKMSYRVEPRAEWTQIFNDTWRWYRDFFYDPGMHGNDWEAIGEKFRAFLPALSSRADLNWLLAQMVGELCVSHTYVFGGDMGPGKLPESTVYTGLLGADLEPDTSGRYRFTRIFGPTEIERDLEAPLARPDVGIRVGDYLLAIDGTPVTAPDDPYRHLQVVRGQKVRLTVSDAPTGAGSRTYEVEPIRSEMQLRYNRWLQENVDRVLAATDGEVGYMHITAMGTDNVAQFDKFWRAFRFKKGLIIDVRGNGGGWTEYFMIDKLERKMVAFNVLANMVPFRYPGSVMTGPVVVLTNEYNGSDGEAFLEHFKARKLGTVIGVPSWGGLVGIINGQRTLDNGLIHQSNNGFYGREGTWWVENHGADPDILLDNDPASASAGRDLQLEKGIEVVREQIEAHPDTFPPLPPYSRR
jgi:tricorn protease